MKTQIPLKLSAYEQSALAELCQIAAGAQYTLFGKQKMPTADELEQFVNAILRYDRINWGTLYDKLHRSGENT